MCEEPKVMTPWESLLAELHQALGKLIEPYQRQRFLTNYPQFETTSFANIHMTETNKNTHITEFIADCVVVNECASTTLDKLIAHYKQWCRDRSEGPLPDHEIVIRVIEVTGTKYPEWQTIDGPAIVSGVRLV